MLLLNLLSPILFALCCLVAADPPAYLAEDADRYDNGSLGRTPSNRYWSSDITGLRLLKRVWDEERCASDKYLFIATRGSRLPHSGPTIIDNDGHQVWVAQGFEATYNFRSQWYRGEQYLTWWSGNDRLGGHGEGYYYMYDKNYQEYKKISPAGDFRSDLHEFRITKQDTALITIYDRIPWDLTLWGGTNESFIWDCLFQEINLETNQLIFQWRATDHFTFNDCYNPRREQNRADPSKSGWDWFHLNSVDKDDKGNYLISSRYSHSISYISHDTGEILWQLGGRNNDFTDISDGDIRATDIAWQHHATWQDDGAAVTVYDNQAVNWNRTGASRALKIALDQTAMTARVVAAAQHPQEYIVHSQGSVSQLDNGNIFVGYGYAAAMAEYSPDGRELLCDWQYGSLHFRRGGTYSPGYIQSYRSFKEDWAGYPLDPPKVAFNNSRLYVSWNGATEHRQWVLEGADEGEEKWLPVGETARNGFESAVALDENEYEVYRLAALDKNGDMLGWWRVLPYGLVEALELPAPAPTPEPSSSHLLHKHANSLLPLALLLSVAGAIYFLRRRGASLPVRLRFNVPKWIARYRGPVGRFGKEDEGRWGLLSEETVARVGEIGGMGKKEGSS